MDTEALMLFSVREFVFALEIGKLLEVVSVDHGRLFRDESCRCEVLVDYRGARIPLVQLASREISSMPDQLQVLVVEGQRPIAVLIDRIIEIANKRGAFYRFPDMLRSGRNRFIKSIYRFNDVMAFVVEPGLISLAGEMSMSGE